MCGVALHSLVYRCRAFKPVADLSKDKTSTEIFERHEHGKYAWMPIFFLCQPIVIFTNEIVTFTYLDYSVHYS